MATYGQFQSMLKNLAPIYPLQWQPCHEWYVSLTISTRFFQSLTRYFKNFAGLCSGAAIALRQAINVVFWGSKWLPKSLRPCLFHFLSYWSLSWPCSLSPKLESDEQGGGWSVVFQIFYGKCEADFSMRAWQTSARAIKKSANGAARK